MAEQIFKGDTAVIEATVYAEDEVTPNNATTVTWTYLRPDGSSATVGPTVISPAAPNNSLVITDTSLVGEYVGTAQFTLQTSGNKKTVLRTWSVVDPLSVASVEKDKTVNLAWKMLEDCFDSELGGPHLRDASLANFDKAKIGDLYDLALYSINVMQPTQTFDAVSFPYANARPLLAKSLECESIKHLMRSYVEQPMITSSGAITYFERRDYLDRWNTLLTIEQLQLKEWVAMYKRQQYNFGVGKLLVDNKTRGLFVPGQLRTRYPRGPIGW